MIPVAVATATGVRDPDFEVLGAALAARGVAAVEACWDDPTVHWDRYALTVVRSTWGYWADPDAYVAWARGVPRLCNPAPVLAWSLDKRYLADLDAAGVPVIETHYSTFGATAVLPDGPVVVKPTVGGGSRGARRFAADDHDAARAHVDVLATLGLEAMVQPLVASVDDNGELDVIVIDGTVSHAVTKRAQMDQPLHTPPAGFATSSAAAPSRAELDVVDAAMRSIPHDEVLCYARVDLVATPVGPCVLELELVEPYLFLTSCDAAAATLAAAIASRSEAA